MKAPKLILSKRSAFFLLVANLIVLLPFVGWMSISPLLPPDYYLMSVPRTLSFTLVLGSVAMGLGASIIATVLIGIPSLYLLSKAEHSGPGRYMREISLWVLIWSLVAGLLFGLWGGGMVAIWTSAGFFLAFCLPANLAGLIYCYLIDKENRSTPLLIFLVVLFLMWNLLSGNFAAVVAGPRPN